jgi:hypothetical protein
VKQRALNALTDKQLELHQLGERFQRAHSFALELQRSTKGKRFDIRNAFAWEAAISAHRMLIIDLSEWIGSVVKWLAVHLQGDALGELRASKRKAAKVAKGSGVHKDADTQRARRRHLEGSFFASYCRALRRLFGKAAEKRRRATEQDVRKLEARLRSWREPLKELRDSAAHAYGDRTESKTRHQLVKLRGRIEKCGRLLNDLRLLLDCATYGLPNLKPSDHNAHARDLVDLIVLGTIEYVTDALERHPGQYYSQKRDAEYARLHRRRRPAKTASFNVDSERRNARAPRGRLVNAKTQ